MAVTQIANGAAGQHRMLASARSKRREGDAVSWDRRVLEPVVQHDDAVARRRRVVVSNRAIGVPWRNVGASRTATEYDVVPLAKNSSPPLGDQAGVRPPFDDT